MKVIILENGTWFDLDGATEKWLDPTKYHEIIRTKHGSFVLHNLPIPGSLSLRVEYETMSKVAAAYYLNKWGYDVPKMLLLAIAQSEV